MNKILLLILGTITLNAKQVYCIGKDTNKTPKEIEDVVNGETKFTNDKFQKVLQSIINEDNEYILKLSFSHFTNFFNDGVLEELYSIYKNKDSILKEFLKEKRNIKKQINNTDMFDLIGATKLKSELIDIQEKLNIFNKINTILTEIFSNLSEDFIIKTISNKSQPEFNITLTSYHFENLSTFQKKGLLKLLLLTKGEYGFFDYHLINYDIWYTTLDYLVKFEVIDKKNKQKILKKLYPNQKVLENLLKDLGI